MGHNLNLVQMLGLPERVTCPECGNRAMSGFEDYDEEKNRIEINPAPGVWHLMCWCVRCGCRWLEAFTLLTEAELAGAFDLSDGACPKCGSTTVLSRCQDGWCFGCMDECQGFAVTAETLAEVMEKWREVVG